MTLILCGISPDCIPLLGFETRFPFELILRNQLLVSKVMFAETIFSGSLKSFLCTGLQWKKYKCKGFL